MRAICNPCPHKETCSYVKQGNERDCIDVQTSDYGYEEAIEDVCKYIRDHIDSNLVIYHKDTWCSLDSFIEAMRDYLLK